MIWSYWMSPPRPCSTANTSGGLDSKGWGEPARRTTARKCHVFPAGAERRRRLTAHDARGSTSRHHPAAVPRVSSGGHVPRPDDGAKSSREHHELLIYDDVRLRPGTRGTCAPLFDEQVPPNPSNPARRKCSRWHTGGAATSNRTRSCPTSLVFTSPRLPPSGTQSAGSARSA